MAHSKTEKASIDGRRQRTERSRLAAIDAALELIATGVLVPTPEQVSERAGVGLRTFFRLFEDREAFFEAIGARSQAAMYQPFRGGNRSGPIEDRVERCFLQRGKAYDSISNRMLTTRALLWKSDTIRANYEKGMKLLSLDLETWLPELRALNRQERKAIDALASFDFWYSLRHDQGLSRKASVSFLSDLLKGYFERLL